jgi:hypothetical protein
LFKALRTIPVWLDVLRDCSGFVRPPPEPTMSFEVSYLKMGPIPVIEDAL